MRKHFFTLFCVLFAASIAAALFLQPADNASRKQEINNATSEEHIAFSYKDPITFTNGQIFSLTEPPAPYTFIFFGFTQCPDMCPTTVHMLETLYQALTPAKRDKTQFIFITLHPEADTPQALDEYFTYANLPILAASLPIGQIEALNNHYALFLDRRDIATIPPVIYHTGDVLMLNQQGELIKRFPFDTEYNLLLDEVNRIIP